MLTSIGVVGAEGRLGRATVARCGEMGIEVSLRAGRDDVDMTSRPSALLGATSPAGVERTAEIAREFGLPLVLATSAIRKADLALLRSLAVEVPVLIAPNLTTGHRLQVRLARLAVGDAAAADWAATVIDRHPATKRDSPSATAIRLASVVDSVGEVRVESRREGDPVADHAVQLRLSPHESLTVVHAVTSIVAAADGSIRALAWLANQPIGWYRLDDLDNDLEAAI